LLRRGQDSLKALRQANVAGIKHDKFVRQMMGTGKVVRLAGALWVRLHKKDGKELTFHLRNYNNLTYFVYAKKNPFI
jgi:aminoglycoside/choline kinase family phosphotransferase